MTTLIDASQLISFTNEESIYFHQIPTNSVLYEIVIKFIEEPNNITKVCHLGEDKKFIRILLNYYRYCNISYQKKLHTDMNWLVFCKKFDIPPITFSSRKEITMWLCSMFDIVVDNLAYNAIDFSLFVYEKNIIIIDILFEVNRKDKKYPPLYMRKVICDQSKDEDAYKYEDEITTLIPYDDKKHHNIWKTPEFLSNSFDINYIKWYSFVNFYIKNDYKYSNIYVN